MFDITQLFKCSSLKINIPGLTWVGKISWFSVKVGNEELTTGLTMFVTYIFNLLFLAGISTGNCFQNI